VVISYTLPQLWEMIFTASRKTPSWSWLRREFFANDHRAPAAALDATLVTGPSHGTLVTGVTDGSFTYMPATNFVGMDTMTYTVSDGQATSKVATITITVLAPGQLFADSFVRSKESRADHTVDCADRQLGHHQRFVDWNQRCKQLRQCLV